MERRQILLGSGALFATALAGCTSASSSQDDGTTDHPQSDTRDQKDSRDENKDSAKHTDNEENKSKQDDKKQKRDDEKEKQQDIPGLNRDAFEIDSDVIRVKKLAYRNHKLDIQVMVTTTDRDVLAEELRALAPAFERALRDADVEEFFAKVEQIKFTVYDEHKNTVFAIFLDLQWLREFLNDDITDEEFADRCLKQMEQA